MFRLFRSGIIVIGSRLILHMRKAAAKEGMDSTLTNDTGAVRTQNSPSDPTSVDLTYDASGIQTQRTLTAWAAPLRPFKSDSTGMTNANRMIGIAQRIGLPPPLSADFYAMWCEPVRQSQEETAQSATQDVELAELPITPNRISHPTSVWSHLSEKDAMDIKDAKYFVEDLAAEWEDDAAGMQFWTPPRDVETSSL